MKHLFVDTNVIIDFLIDRTPFSRHAADLFELAIKNEVNIYISSLCYNNIYYIIRKTTGHDAAIHHLNSISSFTTTLSVDADVVKLALSSGNSDFEDAIQYYTAKTITKIDAIVTRDKTGFKSSDIPVLLPSEALKIALTK